MLKIIADTNIPFAHEAFGTLGEVTLLSGREINRKALCEAEALVVRSVTKVDAHLLEGTPVKFVGTATIGTDHIDIHYLRKKRIAFASAAGSNADSVAEYVVAALLLYALQNDFELSSKTLGIVGVGNVGRKVAAKAEALGMRLLLNDPPVVDALLEEKKSPRQNKTQRADDFVFNDPANYLALDELMQADFVSLHTPLTFSGRYATYYLFDDARLHKMKPGSVLVNTARGAVADNQALKQALREGHLAGAILDVWENEPRLDIDLLKLTTIATPHIAGYSFDGKVKGMMLIYQALCRFLDVESIWEPKPFMPAVKNSRINLEVERHTTGKFLHEIVRCAYDIDADDQALRQGILDKNFSAEQRAAYFDRLRKDYPMRREFQNYRIIVEENAMKGKLEKLGFCCASEE